MGAPTREDLEQAISEATHYRDRLVSDVKSMGQKLKLPQKKIQRALDGHVEIQRFNAILEQLKTQLSAL